MGKRFDNASPVGSRNLDLPRAVNIIDFDDASLALDIEPQNDDGLIVFVVQDYGTATLGSIPSYGFDQVADLVEVKQALTESVIWQLTDPTRFQRMGIEPPRGMLLYGPPGTGKTFVVRALAHASASRSRTASRMASRLSK